MANIILNTGMFKAPGFQELALDAVTTQDLQATINKWEQYYIYQLLSNNVPAYPAGLADLFKTECLANNGVPTSPRFLFIFNAFNQESGDKMYSSFGMLDVMMSIIAFHYVTDNDTWMGTGGAATGNASASKKLNMRNTYRWAEKRFNNALLSVDAIMWWLKTGNANGGGNTEYPEYVYMRHHNQSPFRVKYTSIF